MVLREAIGNASIFGLAIGFIGIMILVFLSSLNYTKAFKIKNRIIDIIEQYDDGYSKATDKYGVTNRENINAQVEDILKEIGYRVNVNNRQCPTIKKDGVTYSALNSTYNYQYCIYEFSSARGHYYKVTAYMYLSVPLIDWFLEFPVSGETKVFYHTVDEHGRPNNNIEE